MKKILSFFFYILLFLLIASLGFPILIDLVLIFVFFILIKNNLPAVSFFVFLFLILVSANLLFIKKLQDKEIFYRAHEKFSDKDFIYKKNINYEMTMPHGDIPALDFCNDSISINEVRTQKFITDKNGYRNDFYNLESADIVLIGDSFIAGSSSSQEDTPANILMNLTNKKVYSLASISDPESYEFHIKKNLKHMDKNIKLLIFYFAGNDFEYHFENNNKYLNYNGIQIPYLKYKIRFGYERLERNKDKLFIEKLSTLYKNNFFYKKIRPKSQRAYKKILSKWTNACLVEIQNIKNFDIGFYYKEIKNYKNVSTHIITDQEILKKIYKVYYIPTKYIIYKKYFNKEETKKNDLVYLKENYKKLGIQVEDLTPILQQAADDNLKNDKFIYWRDDTHWNKLGIITAMKFIENDLKK